MRPHESRSGKEVRWVAGLPLLAKFDDYEAFRMDVGYRHYLDSGSLSKKRS